MTTVATIAPDIVGYDDMVGVEDTADASDWVHTDGLDLCDRCVDRLAALCDDISGGNDG